MKHLAVVAIYALYLFSTAPACAWNVVSMCGSTPTAATCTEVITQDSSNQTDGVFLYGDYDSKGQSFQLTSAGKLCSIWVKLGDASPGSPAALYCRVGTTNNLSSTYWEADNNITSFSAGAWVEFTWASGPDLSASTTYYILFRSADNSWGDRLFLSSHSDGATYGSGLIQTGDDWIGSGTESDDLAFKVETK